MRTKDIQAVRQSGPEDEPVKQHVDGYLHQLRSITVTRHLFPIIVACQKHRGAKLALLEGDKFFKHKEIELQAEIENRLIALSMLNKEMNFPAKEHELEAILHEWETVKSWSGGPSLENYNLHSHFIEQQMKLIWQIVENTSCFVAKSFINLANKEETGPGDDSLLIRFILHETPELVELVAQIRGLATYTIAIGRCSDEQQKNLEYMLTILNQKKEKFRDLSKELQKYVMRDVPALIELQMQDVRLIQLVQLVNKVMLNVSDNKGDDHSVFYLASNIIDSQMEIVKQGLDYIQKKVHHQFDCWHYSMGNTTDLSVI